METLALLGFTALAIGIVMALIMLSTESGNKRRRK